MARLTSTAMTLGTCRLWSTLETCVRGWYSHDAKYDISTDQPNDPPNRITFRPASTIRYEYDTILRVSYNFRKADVETLCTFRTIIIYTTDGSMIDNTIRYRW
ncbi:hypothetical protein C7212DRAFT_363088 [Tuber magnatum]|uniref:Uncharacterized protein n=1 Tax=Tuber magnatum TaxID=42249 RepID=A0A317SXF3_9PEZI|nr:hypothetical protein C7212DRAFT_363088 [Tuber magnatum]